MVEKPRIVVLDGYTLNPGDLSWDELLALGECQIHDRTPSEQTVARASEATLVLTNKTVLDDPVLAALPRLRYIGVLATGYNVVDVAAARARRVIVTNVPDYSTRSVIQLTLALLLELAQHVGLHGEGVRQGRWCRSLDFCYWETPLVELAGLTLGVVGFGRIGRGVAHVAAALGMSVLVHTPRPASPAPTGVEFVGLDALFQRSDVVSLHCPLTPETRHLVNAARLALLRPRAFLINTGRGPLVDQAALAEALEAGRLAGAALDVLSTEPPAVGNPLLSARNCLITPHIGWATKAARARLMRIAIDNVRGYLDGRPQNVVG
jgi:glycerate dehydrogenase